MGKLNVNHALRGIANDDDAEFNGALRVDEGIAVTSGGLTVTAGGITVAAGVANFNAAGLRTVQAVNQVHDTTPTAAELTTSFGAIGTLGRGFIGTVDDNDGDTNGYIVWASDASFYFVKGTKAS